jgi:fructan beta-fructosidase
MKNLIPLNKRVLTLLLVFVVGVNFHCHAQSNYQEPYRPQFHFTPAAHWMNDPNGLIYFNGKYHLFYQYYPEATVWGPMHWGHAVSTDLLHWKHLPIALYPDSLGWIFSGSAIIDSENTAGFGKNAMIAIFTYHNDEIWQHGDKKPQSQGIAYSLDEGLTWTKYTQNPVLKHSGEQDFRDPKVFWHKDSSKWIMTLATGDRIKLFSSSNLKNWQFESEFKPEEKTELGVWECPDLFQMEDEKSGAKKWILIVNHGDKAPNGGSGGRYFVGDFDGKTFTKTQDPIWLDYGTDFYAAVTFSNLPSNRHVLLGWMSNWQYAVKVPTDLWRSAMTLPRELKLISSNGTYVLNQSIVSEFNSISQPYFEKASITNDFSKEYNLQNSQISFDVDAKDNQQFQLAFSNKLGEEFVITFENGLLKTNRLKSGKVDFSDSFAAKIQEFQLTDKLKNISLIIDQSSVEILVNDGAYSMTNLFFPTEGYARFTISNLNNTKITNLKINTLESVWSN